MIFYVDGNIATTGNVDGTITAPIVVLTISELVLLPMLIMMLIIPLAVSCTFTNTLDIVLVIWLV